MYRMLRALEQQTTMQFKSRITAALGAPVRLTIGRCMTVQQQTRFSRENSELVFSFLRQRLTSPGIRVHLPGLQRAFSLPQMLRPLPTRLQTVPQSERGQPTFAFSISTSTITNAATLYISGALKSDNASSTNITNAHGLLIASNALTASVVTNGYGLTVNAPTGATRNYAAEFLGGNVGIGTTTPYSRLTVWGPDNASSTLAFNIVNNASSTVFAVFDGGNAQLSGTLTQSSDQRLKTNIQSLDASTSLRSSTRLTRSHSTG